MNRAQAERWLLVGIGGLALFLATLATLHALEWLHLAQPAVLRPNSVFLAQPRHISAYALGSYSWLWYGGVLGLGTGMIAFAVGLDGLLPRVQNGRGAMWLLAEAGALVLILDVFPTDHSPLPETVPGALHDLAAIGSLLLQGASMVLFSAAGGRHPAWQATVGSSPAWAAGATILAIGWGLLDILPAPFWEMGAIAQRALAVFLVGWMLMVAFKARGLAASSEAHLQANLVQA
jgi:hypothetical protein